MADEATTPAAPAPAVKPGYATTEFWIHLLVTIAGLVMAAFPANSKPVQIAGMVLSLGSALGYTASRTSVKNAAMLLMVLTLSLAMGACCSLNTAPLKSEVDTENTLMAELSAYVSSDPKKSDDLKKAEAARIKAHLDLFNSLISK